MHADTLASLPDVLARFLHGGDLHRLPAGSGGGCFRISDFKLDELLLKEKAACAAACSTWLQARGTVLAAESSAESAPAWDLWLGILQPVLAAALDLCKKEDKACFPFSL